MSYVPVPNSQSLTLYLGICGTGRAVASSTSLTDMSFGTVYNPRPSITFDPSDVGMPIAIVGGGPVDADMPPVYFVQGALFHTTIAAFVSSTEVTLTDAPDTSIYNSGFATVILYRPCPIASDVATTLPLQFQFNSSIAPGTNDTMQFSTFNTLGDADNPYVDRFGPILLGQPVYLTRTDPTDGVVEVFGGYIDSLTTSSMPGVAGVPYSWSAQCVSWSGLARRRVVPPANPQTFTSVAGDQVFRHVVLDYVSDDGVAVSVSTAPDITLACAVGANIGQLLDQIVGLVSTADTAWYWTTDAWRTFILATRTAVSAPWNITSGDDLLAGETPYQQSVTATHNQTANTVYTIGTQTLLNTLQAIVVGNGTAVTFNLPEPIGAAPTITLNAGSQTVGVLGVDTGVDWYWSQGSAVLTQDSGGTVLAPSDTLDVTYTPLSPAVAQALNVASLQQLQAIEGTSATYGYSQQITQPILPADLLAFTTAYEIEYGEPATTCQLYTLWPGLATGQLQSIALPEAGIPSGDYLIATVQMTTINGVIMWQYTAFGGANIGNALTALTQFINRNQATLALISPTTPIVSPVAVGNPINQTSSGTAFIPVAFPNPVTQGNLLVIVVCGPAGVAQTFSDTLGNTWTQAARFDGGTHFSAIFWAVANSSGADTVSNGIGLPVAFFGFEFPGIYAVSPIDATSGGATAQSVTTNYLYDLVITAFSNFGDAPSVIAPETILASFLDPLHGSGLSVGKDSPASPGSFTSSLISSPVGDAYATVAFRPIPTSPPAQTTTVQANPQGTVSHSTGALTLNEPIFGNGAGDIKAAACDIATTAPLTGGGDITPSGLTLAVSTATTSSLGVVQPDGTTITISAGVISAALEDDIQINGTTSLNIIRVNGTQVWIGQTEIQLNGTFI